MSEFMVFCVGTEWYATDIFLVQEIREIEPLTKLQGTPGVEGVLNLRGDIVPIVDLRTMLHCSAGSPVNTPPIVIILNLEKGTVGAIVSAVSDVLAIDPQRIKQTPGLIAEAVAHVTGFFNNENNNIAVVDMNLLIGDKIF